MYKGESGAARGIVAEARSAPVRWGCPQGGVIPSLDIMRSWCLGYWTGVSQDPATVLPRRDAAVFAAYGWPEDIADESTFKNVLALNLERSASQG